MTTMNLKDFMAAYVPLPLCVINSKGKVVCAGENMNQVFLYDGIVDADIFALTGIRASQLYDAADTGNNPALQRNGKIFRMICHRVDDQEDSNLAIMFSDVTSLENLKDKYNDEKICIAKIKIDNYDELIANTSVEYRTSVPSEIDKTVRRWADRIAASVNRMGDDSYLAAFEQKFLPTVISAKFDILDEIRAIETATDFPVSLSIGVGAGGENPIKTEEYADAALDLALGRGGDQAVLKRNSKIEYFGGKLQTVEKRNKGKSRIVGHALKQLIDQSQKIFIMGHANPDMDCFGASLGIYRICTLCGIEPYIVIDNYKEPLQAIFKQAKESDNYRFISSERAQAMAEKESLVMVMDTHRPSMVQCPELLEICDRKVIIDHHRRVEDFIENPVLAYMETYASSTSELVAEILQYVADKKVLTKLEAEALLAGITVDTNGFTVKTGVRTFEAAAWLRRQGADPTEVSRFFQEGEESFMIKAHALADAQSHENGIMTSICSRKHPDEQVICAQVADQLLTVKGTRASFVAGINGEGKTVISARSLGEVNVQMIMEKFNGGGHLTTAAAQVLISPEEAINEIMKIMEEK